MIDPSLYDKWEGHELCNAPGREWMDPEMTKRLRLPKPQDPMVGAAAMLGEMLEQLDTSSDEAFKQKLKTKFNQAVDLMTELAVDVCRLRQRIDDVDKMAQQRLYAVDSHLCWRIGELEKSAASLAAAALGERGIVPRKLDEVERDIKRLYHNSEAVVAMLQNENRGLRREIDALWKTLSQATGLPRAAREEVSAAADKDYRARVAAAGMSRGVMAIGVDLGKPGGDHTAMTMRRQDGLLVVVENKA